MATCCYGRGEGAEKSGAVEFKGIGKYPHVVVRLSPESSRSRGRGGTGGERGGQRAPATEEEGGGRTEGDDGDGCGAGREVVVRFGSVAVGTSAQRCVELINVSPVSLASVFVHAYTVH